MVESTAGVAGASGRNRNDKSGRSDGGKNKAGNRSGRYVPPHQRAKKPQGGRKGASSESTSNIKTSNDKTPPKKGRGQNGGTPRSRSTNNKSYQNSIQKVKQRVRIYSSDGDGSGISSFRQMRNDCKAVRYKVHKPRSDCPRILRLFENHDFSDELTTSLTLEDGKIDALVVVPDTKQKYAYVCRDTPLTVFEDDPRKAEEKLRDELFPKATTAETTDHEDTPSSVIIDETKFKLSCGSCLLMHEPNGFCLIVSPSASVVDRVCDWSWSKRREKEARGRPLHTDHAHFVARLPRSSLWNLQRSKTRAQTSTAIDEILGHLSGQDIDAVHDPERLTDGIKLGHHLLSVLALTRPSDDFWFVMGYDDNKSLELDLPGGKRHLGESSLEGAIRETEEETSLVWDDSWVASALQSKKRSDVCNRYFVLHPPQLLLEDQIADQ